MGVTGAREQTSSAAPKLVARVKRVTDLPVGVGLGVRDAGQVAEVASYADAVIVGSALVTALGERGEQGVRELTAHLATGLPK
jgi:tryptophan synthase alpha chain